MSVNALKSIQYSLGVIQDEARQRCIKWSADSNDLHLCQYIPPREWVCIESELENVTFYCVA